MSDNIIEFPKEFSTTGEISVEDVLDGIDLNELDTVVVLGWDKDGREYFSSSTPNGMEIIWLMERIKYKIMESMG